MSNEKFKNITSTEDNSTTYRDKLIDLLSKDQEGNRRYCNIREYVLSPNGPSEKLNEFFCNLMEEDREIIDNIYNRLPIEVTNENENQNLNRRIRNARIGGTIGGGIVGRIVGDIGGIILAIPLSFIPVIGPFIPYISAGGASLPILVYPLLVIG